MLYDIEQHIDNIIDGNNDIKQHIDNMIDRNNDIEQHINKTKDEIKQLIDEEPKCDIIMTDVRIKYKDIEISVKPISSTQLLDLMN